MTAAIGGAALNLGLAKLGSDKAAKRKSVPRFIETGFSSFDTKKGKISLDPSIRAGQERFTRSIRDLIPETEGAFDEFDEGLEGLRGRSTGLRADFEGNQSAFREAALNPVRESIARGRGDLVKRLERTDVKGSFSNQEQASFDITAGRALSDTEAKIEAQRIDTLSSFLGLDAELLKAGLSSDTGRIALLTSLESSLRGVSSERFDQELALLGLPAALQGGKAADNERRDSSEGVVAQAATELLGTIFEGLG